MNKTLLAAGLGAALLLPTISQADGANLPDWYLAPSLKFIFDDADRGNDHGFGVGLALGKELNEWFNTELELTFDRLDAKENPEVKQAGAALNGLFFFSRDPSFSPFVLAGVGRQSNDNGASDSTSTIYNLGVGFIQELVKDSAYLRADVRARFDDDNDTVAGEDDFTDYMVSLGVQVPLGKPPAPPAPVVAAPADSDGDGVTDDLDACPGTPPGQPVDARGCELDSDGDGVIDRLDRCPGTPAGAPVDANGCELDSDGDGVVDRLDDCPNTPAGTRVDIHGCPIPEKIVLRGVHFEYNSAKLTAASEAILDDMAATLRKHPDLSVRVEGHTDSVGSDKFNLGLSERRAATVMKYLVAQGANADKLTAIGYGESQPVSSNDTDAGRAENRRVELQIDE
ncbi:MAG: OmpA family protein [Chromatiales bacterium]|nr:OmpA family protein [Chromatiales bacterium]